MPNEEERYVRQDSPEDVAMQEKIKSDARWDLFRLGKSFERHCGRFIWFGSTPPRIIVRSRTK